MRVRIPLDRPARWGPSVLQVAGVILSVYDQFCLPFPAGRRSVPSAALRLRESFLLAMIFPPWFIFTEGSGALYPISIAVM